MNKSQIADNAKDTKVALVHDFLVCRGGAEKVLLTLSEMFPGAPIYTLLYDKKAMRGMFDGKDIRTSFLQKFPKFLRKRYRWLLPFFPVAIESFDLRDFDTVISSSGAWSKGIVTRLNTRHIAYIHSPMRYAWDYNERYLKEELSGGRLSLIKRMALSYIRVWDRQAADRPDALIANSRYTQARIEKYYRRESVLVYPPVIQNKEQTLLLLQTNKEARDFYGFRSKEYFLIVSRLTPNKKVDIAVEAFNKLGLPLIIVGEGQQQTMLRSIAKENIKVIGWKNDATVNRLYANARAFVFPAEDDFGMTLVEALAHGVPAIAYAQGGALEIVEEGKTGELFASQTPEVLADGVRRFLEKENQYESTLLHESAQRFSRDHFEQSMKAIIDQEVL